MSGMNFLAEIATEYWNKEDYFEIESILNAEFNVKEKQYARWSVESGDPALFASFTLLSGPLIDSVVNFLLSKIFEKFAKKLAEKMSKKNYPHLALSFHNQNNSLIFELTSTDEQTILKSLDAMKDILKQNTLRNDKEYFFYNKDKAFWEMLINKPTNEEITVIITGTQPFEKDGKKIVLTEDDLNQVMRYQRGMPVLLGHHGKIIGIILDAWIEQQGEFKVVKGKVGIFDDVSSKERDDFRNCKGISLAGSY